MTSEEIAKVPYRETDKVLPDAFWLKEIAYQLAIFNERQALDLNQFLKGGKPL